MGLLFAGDDSYDDVLRAVTDANLAGVGLTGDQFFALVKGVIARESGWHADAYHYDAAYEQRHGLPPDPILHASFGLMQVEGQTAVDAHEVDRAGVPTWLADPTNNFHAGVRLLADNLRRADGDVEIAVAAYNAGWSEVRANDAPRNPDGTFLNQGYVDDVTRFYGQYLAAGGGPAVAGTDASVLGFVDFGAVPWWGWGLLGLGIAAALARGRH